MPVVNVTVHPSGLHPLEAVKAYHKWQEEGMSLDEVISEGVLVNVQGDVPGRKALYNAIRRVAAMSTKDHMPNSKYARCGRKKALTPSDAKKVVKFVKQWRNKVFCTCKYIRRELRLLRARDAFLDGC